MSRLQYYPLKVAEVRPEAGDARSIVFEIPAALAETFRFKPGQHLQRDGQLAIEPVRAAPMHRLVDQPRLHAR